ncbi:MAG: hypothetical protein HC772_16810 [Leptolyngbyaceae cyanobacterium CRU_2_3]|nr:hypothetical protein [Leptolyngbyaceae cyanobacterium CRU_2_3]
MGLVERFQDSLYLLSYIFGWNPIINTRRENAAKSKSPLAEIPASTLEIIKANSAYDIELYQYAKEIFEQRFNQMTQDLAEKYLSQLPSIQTQPGLSTASNPLSSDSLAKLLDRHYNQRYAELRIPASNHTVYDFAQPLRGSGWQRRERTKEIKGFRWMGPKTTATLDLPLKTDETTDLIVEFRLFHTHLVPPDILESLSVQVNGHPIVINALHTEQGLRFYQGWIPQAILKNDRVFTEFKFQVNRTTSLQGKLPTTSDTRVLGLAFSHVQVYPVKLQYEKSALAATFKSPPWKFAAEFLRQHPHPEAAIAAPLIFSLCYPMRWSIMLLFLLTPQRNGSYCTKRRAIARVCYSSSC